MHIQSNFFVYCGKAVNIKERKELMERKMDLDEKEKINRMEKQAIDAVYIDYIIHEQAALCIFYLYLCFHIHICIAFLQRNRNILFSWEIYNKQQFINVVYRIIAIIISLVSTENLFQSITSGQFLKSYTKKYFYTMETTSQSFTAV